MPSHDAYTIRPLTRAEIELPIGWAAAEGWNPGRHDAECFYAADPSGFLAGFLDDRAVATISVVRYGTAFGFLGLYIVDREFRGRGYGMRIWNAGLSYLAGRTVGLDGVIAQQDNYRRSGFVLAHRNIRHEGRGGAHRALDPRIVALTSLPIDVIVSYDRSLFPEQRSAFIRSWIRQRESTALGFVQNGGLAGYGVIRPARSGYKVGPLFADTADAAEALYDALQAAVPREATLCLDTPEVNRAALALAERQGMQPVFETARMYKGIAPALPLDRLYGVTTFELG